MKFKKYIQELIKYTKEHPESMKMDVIFGGDDEGNSFHFVNYTPSMGEYTEDGIFLTANIEYVEEIEVNAVCIN